MSKVITRLLTNFSKEDLDKYQTAIAIYNVKRHKCDLFIHRSAFASDGRDISAQNMSLHTSTPGYDKSDFWKIFDKC